MLYTVYDLKKFSREKAANFLLEILEKGSLELSHPFTKERTYLRQNICYLMHNILMFSNEKQNHHWYLIQESNLVDAFIVGDSFHKLNMQHDYVELVDLISNNKIHFDKTSSNTKIDGLVFSSNRPYHFMYDQMVNYFYLSQKQNIDQKCFAGRFCFYNDLPGNTSFRKEEESGCYLFPVLRGSNYSDYYAEKLHEHVLFLDRERKKYESELTIWFGITGQKRSWIEQIEGYTEITKRLIKHFSSITIVIDGWTNAVDDISINDEDSAIANQIKSNLTDLDNVKFVDLVSRTYKEKIYFAKSIDCFIANSGTGSMIPHVFMNKKGVIHGNGKVSLFKNRYTRKVKTIPISKIISDENEIPGENSYSIHWTTIYNALCDLLYLDDHIEELSPNGMLYKKNFQFIDITKFHSSADALIDVAIGFEKSKDIKTAYKLMKVALLLRPEGPFIGKKVKEYEDQLLS